MTAPNLHDSLKNPVSFNSCVFRRSTLIIEACTTALAQLVGYEEGDGLVGAFVIDLFSPRSLASFERFLRMGDFADTVQCTMAGGLESEQTMVVTVAPTSEDAGCDLFTLVCVPVTDYSATISMLEAKILALQEQNKRQVELSTLLTHDLRGSLHAILGDLDLLQHRGEQDLTQSTRASLDRMQRAGVAMNRVLDDVTRLLRVRGGSFPMVLTELNTVADELISEALAMASDDVQIVRSGDLGTVMCREHLIRELIRNLLENSIKYGGPGAVTVEIGARHSDVPTFFVKDDGVGIHAEDLDQVLAPLTRADRDGLNTQGTGMGLALVAAIVERHAGRVWLESTRDVGTTVCFQLSEHGDDVAPA